MHEFDKCCFCAHHYPESKRYDKCEYPYSCIDRQFFQLDVKKVVDKAKMYDISVTDVLNLMKEVTE